MEIAIPLAVVAVGWLWTFSRLVHTSNQRKELINYIFAQRNWKELLAKYQRVSFNQHYFRVLFFRNPKYLYDEDLWIS